MLHLRFCPEYCDRHTRNSLEIDVALEPRVPVPSLNLERNPAIKTVLHRKSRKAFNTHFSPLFHSSPAPPQPSGNDKFSSSSDRHEASIPSSVQLTNLTLVRDALGANGVRAVAVGFLGASEAGRYKPVTQQAQLDGRQQRTQAALDVRRVVARVDQRSRLPEPEGFQGVEGRLEGGVVSLERRTVLPCGHSMEWRLRGEAEISMTNRVQ